MASCANVDLDVPDRGSRLERVPARTMHGSFTVDWMNSLLHTCSSTDLDSLTGPARQGARLYTGVMCTGKRRLPIHGLQKFLIGFGPADLVHQELHGFHGAQRA